MKSLILKDLVSDSSSNSEGTKLFKELRKAFENRENILLHVDSELTLSSSFLNTSFGVFLDKYGFENFKRTVKIKGSQNQFARLASYIERYRPIA
jgi:hypothetical protein